MEEIIIKVSSDTTSSAIKDFVRQFPDAIIENAVRPDDNYFIETYGLNKKEFENNLNLGIAQTILGITKPWHEVKEELLAKVNKP